MSGIDDALAALVDAGQLFHRRGWVPATGGNFSARVDGQVHVTESGYHKGELTAGRFVKVDDRGLALPGEGKASAEARLHAQIYRRWPDAGAVLHTHSVASTVLSRRHERLRLSDYELLKILEGVTTHQVTVEIPVFENDQDIEALAGVVDAAMERGEARHGYLIRGHGLYAWGRDVAQARWRVEALEFLMECELHAGDNTQ